MVSIQCPRCEIEIVSEEEALGEEIHCPNCGNNVPIPQLDAPEKTLTLEELQAIRKRIGY